MLLDVLTSLSWLTIQGRLLVFEHYLLFSQVIYIYPRMFHMILIILFQVYCTRFLQPPLKEDSGLLVLVVIMLLGIV
jgi:hypothetical protein